MLSVRFLVLIAGGGGGVRAYDVVKVTWAHIFLKKRTNC